MFNPTSLYLSILQTEYNKDLRTRNLIFTLVSVRMNPRIEVTMMHPTRKKEMC